MAKGMTDAMTRRMAQDPRLKKRLNAYLIKVAQGIQRRRLTEWIDSPDEVYPQMEDSVVMAKAEVDDFCRALGRLIAIDPIRFDLDRILLHHMELDDAGDWDDEDWES